MALEDGNCMIGISSIISGTRYEMGRSESATLTSEQQKG
jgi:hypothetical protein